MSSFFINEEPLATVASVALGTADVWTAAVGAALTGAGAFLACTGAPVLSSTEDEVPGHWAFNEIQFVKQKIISEITYSINENFSDYFYQGKLNFKINTLPARTGDSVRTRFASGWLRGNTAGGPVRC